MKLLHHAFLLALPLLALADDTTMKVMTLNFACRDLYPLAACDNCQTRLDRIASAILNEEEVDGLPNLDTVDVFMAQELGTASENFQQISDALARRGFRYFTREPAPTAADPICQDPILWNQNDKEIAAGVTGLQSGGLVTWSRYPIMDHLAQNWCNHLFPTPSGYLLTLLDVGGGRVAAVFNLHMTPEYDTALLYTKDIRTFQFGEVSALANNLRGAFREARVPFSIVLGGDFNEDIYNRQSKRTTSNCGLLLNDDSQLVKQKFDSLNLDVTEACQRGIIGTPTWDPTNNDQAKRGSSSGTHQVLDYLIQHSSSSSSVNVTPINQVTTLKTKRAWQGQFCIDTNLGEAGRNNLYTSNAYALADHNLVTASFLLPIGSGSLVDAYLAFNNVVRKWNNDIHGEVDRAACGQQDTVCRTDADCCTAEYSWNGQGQHCDSDFACSPCASLGQGCGAQWEGSECCKYEDYSSGRGAHCEMDSWTSVTATCILKFSKGEACLWDEECQSKNCSWTWRGKKCE